MLLVGALVILLLFLVLAVIGAAVFTIIDATERNKGDGNTGKVTTAPKAQ